MIEAANPPDTATISFESNLERRVRNLALGPKTPSNALVPLYEAVYNSLHAIQDRFGEDWASKARIQITLLGFDDAHPSIEILDNGIGLNDENFRSFRTYDSDLKVGRGGKGVGRLAWLKVFEKAQVSSSYLAEGKVLQRSFSLNLDNAAPIQQHVLQEGVASSVGTYVKLCNMRADYAKHVPTRISTVLKKLVGHFLPYLLSVVKPSIVVQTHEESFDLSDFLAAKQISLGETDIADAEGEDLKIKHNLLEHGVAEGSASHRLYFAANGRVVNDIDIGLALGLKTYIDRDGERYAYAGVITGRLLDENVNSERTTFDLEAEKLEAITRATMALLKETLKPQIDRVISQQTELTRNVVKRYPRFAYMIGDPRAFVETKVPRNFRSAEQIYQQLAVLDFRENRDLDRKVEGLSKDGELSADETIQHGVDAILKRLNNQEFSVLADYTVRRKVILDVLEKRLGYKPDGTMKHHAEEALHSFVVPMRATSSDVHIEKHNLWIIDDKLTYYEHWASDKKMKTILKSGGSDDRPDVLLMGGRTVFHRPGTDQPIVIIEFKKPARTDYSDDENPFTQVYGYIEELRAGKVMDREGGVIQEVDQNTPFFCYIIADLTPKLRSWLRMAQINVPLPGGAGYYGYNDNYKAFVQVLSYKYVLKDARMRNEAFFKQLSI